MDKDFMVLAVTFLFLSGMSFMLGLTVGMSEPRRDRYRADIAAVTSGLTPTQRAVYSQLGRIQPGSRKHERLTMFMAQVR